MGLRGKQFFQDSYSLHEIFSCQNLFHHSKRDCLKICAVIAAITVRSSLTLCQAWQESAAPTKVSGPSAAVAAGSWEQNLCKWAKG